MKKSLSHNSGKILLYWLLRSKIWYFMVIWLFTAKFFAKMVFFDALWRAAVKNQNKTIQLDFRQVGSYLVECGNVWWCFFLNRQEVEILPLHISHSRDQLCKSLTREYISTCFNKYLLNIKMVSENKTNWKFFFQFNFKILCWQ